MVVEVFVSAPGAPWAIVSDQGTVMTNRRSRARGPRPYREAGGVDPAGYPVVNFRETGPLRVHRLVALAFLGEPPASKRVVRHLNGNKLDNRVENLAWGNDAENTADMLRLGEIKVGPESPAWKTHCIAGHLLQGANVYYPPSGGRQCRACKNTKGLARYHQLMSEGRHPRQLARVNGKDSDLYPTPWELVVEKPQALSS